MGLPKWYMDRVSVELMKLGIRGISVLVAPGDDGVNCADDRAGGPDVCSRTCPDFPSVTPWVTVVGGTQLSTQATPVCGYSSATIHVNCREEAEVACSSETGGKITTGGGFSGHFPAPWYQLRAVEKYFNQSDSPVPPSTDSWRYNTKGRGYPDISAIANDYLVWMSEGLQTTSGTSASTPVMAAIVTHWNEARLKAGKPPLGFLNPLLYKFARQHPEAFNDVLVGNNRCSSRGFCCEHGFGAARGWDAVTGVGSPKFGVISQLLEELGQPATMMAERADVADLGLPRGQLAGLVSIGAFLVTIAFSLGKRSGRMSVRSHALLGDHQDCS